MIISAIEIRPDGTYERFEFDSGDDFDGLTVLQTRVGGYFETQMSADQKVCLWFNEEGGPEIKALQVNPIATEFWWQVCPYMRGAGRPMFGNVIVTGGVDEHGGTLGLDDEQLAAIRKWIETAGAKKLKL